jgi:uncharacterized protein (DUF2141 family)
LLLLAGLCCGTVQAKSEGSAGAKGDVMVSVQGLGSTEGVVRWAVFASPEAFSQAMHGEVNTSVRAGTSPPREGDLRFEIRGLEYGDYALMLFHDENMNDKVDKRALGLPKERVGVSNYSSRPMRKPVWSKARFSHNQPQTQLTIKTFR